MKRSADYLDDIKDRYNLPSDYAVAKRLGISKQSVSNYRHGTTAFAADVAPKVAELLDLDEIEVFASARASQAKDPEERAIFEKILKRLGGTTAAFAVAVSLHGVPTPAHASASASVEFDNLHIIANRGRLGRRRAGFRNRQTVQNGRRTATNRSSRHRDLSGLSRMPKQPHQAAFFSAVA